MVPESRGSEGLTLSEGITTKNQFAAPMVYDAAGNLTNDGAHPFTYDTENRLATAGGVTYNSSTSNASAPASLSQLRSIPDKNEHNNA